MNRFAPRDTYVLVDHDSGEVIFLFDGYARAEVYKLHGRGYFSTFTVLDVNPDYAATLFLPWTSAELEKVYYASIVLERMHGRVNLFPTYLRHLDERFGTAGAKTSQ